MRCRKCKAAVETGFKFCPNCGAKVTRSGAMRAGGRILALALVLAMVVGDVGSAADAPFEAYLAAADKTTADGSWAETIRLSADVVLMDGKRSMKKKATLKGSAEIEGWRGEDTSTLYVRYHSAYVSMWGKHFDYTSTWQNGMEHCEYTAPVVTSMDLQIDPSYFNPYTFTEEIISSAAKIGNRIVLHVSGEDLAKTDIAMLALVPDDMVHLRYDDAAVHVTLDEESGKIDEIMIAFWESMRLQEYGAVFGAEYDAEVDYQVHIGFSEHTGTQPASE